jgi:hypothetical protein
MHFFKQAHPFQSIRHSASPPPGGGAERGMSVTIHRFNLSIRLPFLVAIAHRTRNRILDIQSKLTTIATASTHGESYGRFTITKKSTLTVPPQVLMGLIFLPLVPAAIISSISWQVYESVRGIMSEHPVVQMLSVYSSWQPPRGRSRLRRLLMCSWRFQQRRGM